MKHTSIIVRADWDEEVKVWVATSTDIDGLALEADSVELLMEKIPGALCDLIELNDLSGDYDLPEIPFHLMASKIGRIPNPAH